MGTIAERFAICFAVVLAHSEARADECSPPTPECHLKVGTKLLQSDPKRAAEQLLASFKLDERTETLTLYATALQADKQYARALETWQRIILFRESEVEAAKEAMRRGPKAKRAAAKAAEARAQEQSEQAAAEIMKLWSSVAKVRIQLAPGQKVVVTDDGVEVDATKEVLVNAGRDELTFTRADGSSEKVIVEVAPGQLATIDAPKERAELPVVTPARPIDPPVAVEPKPASVVETPKPDLAVERYVEKSSTMSRVGLGLAAVGVVGLGVSGTFGFLASRDFDDARALGCNADAHCPIGPASELAEQSNDRARFAQFTAIGGGALAITGATLWILGRGKTRRTVTDVTVSVGPSSVSLGWSMK